MNKIFLKTLPHLFSKGRGRAELTRMIFAAANVKFNDERVEGWPKGKEGKNNHAYEIIICIVSRHLNL